MNILDMCLWNKVAIIKTFWATARKKDCLWIEWVHSFYIKRGSLESFPLPKNLQHG